MKYTYHPAFRICSIDPCRQGFGFAILDEPAQLLDWGVKNCSRRRNAGTTAHARSIAAFRRLLDRYQPTHVIVRRNKEGAERHHRFVDDCAALTADRGLAIQVMFWEEVEAVFRQIGVTTKEGIAAAVGYRFGELLPLPRHRKTWMSEDYRMNIYDAVAIGLASRQVAEGLPKIRSQ